MAHKEEFSFLRLRLAGSSSTSDPLLLFFYLRAHALAFPLGLLCCAEGENSSKGF